MEKFYDLLFEISNDYRHEILLRLLDEPMRVTDISKELDLTSQEISRHVARLGEAGLTHKDVDGIHHVTQYGALVLNLLDELQFASLHNEYFIGHSLSGIPHEFVKRIGDLKESDPVDNVIYFLKGIEKLIQESKQHVFFIADQFPLSSIGFINEALDRGVRFKSIGKNDGPPGSLFNDKLENNVSRVSGTPLIEYKALESLDLLLFVSEGEAAIAFPTTDGGFDYRGFITKNRQATKWAEGLFEYFWERAEPRSKLLEAAPRVTPEDVTYATGREGVIIVEGRDDHRVDPFAVQDAVDNYDEVILRGVFNFEGSTVTVRKSVHIRGEGREDDIPSTVVCRRHWSFPSAVIDQLFLIEGENVEVTIENIHFTDFFAYCILGWKGRKVNIINNRITLESGFYRGITNIAFGDGLIGFLFIDDFPGGVNVEGNYIDFATEHLFGGYLLLESMKGPDGKPDCVNHKYFSSYCVYIRDVPGNIRVANNTFKNMTARAISVCGSTQSTKVTVSGNLIVSDVNGSYVVDNRWAGIGIAAHCSWHQPKPGFKLNIENNVIKYSKPGFCGIALLGPRLSPKGSGKLADGVVRGNQVELKDGSVGILVESCDGFDVNKNKIAGTMRYGIGLFPRTDPERPIMGAFENAIEDNDMNELEILPADGFNQGLFPGEGYLKTRANEETAHIWLNPNTGKNRVKAGSNVRVVDEGKENIIEVVD